MTVSFLETCPQCDGVGRIKDQLVDCWRCGGTGTVPGIPPSAVPVSPWETDRTPPPNRICPHCGKAI